MNNIFKSILLASCIANVVISFQSSRLSRKVEDSFYDALAGTDFSCPFKTSDCSEKKYSNFDGSCNNLVNPHYGEANTPLRRLLPAEYDDGISSPKTLDIKRETTLPNPRFLSTTMHNDNFSLENIWTHIWTTFGQFLTHDIGETSLSSKDGSRPDCPCGSTDESCFSFEIPEDDPVFEECMKFVRSSASFQTTDCTSSVREQFNIINSYIDASTVYGNSKDDSDKLRSFVGGKLLTSDGIESGKDFLPHTEDTCSSNGDDSMNCFMSGDVRTTENLGLTGIHTVFLREHNRIATELGALNPDWDDDRLYNETRRIIIAVLQHIVYDQYVPSVIGNAGNIVYGLDPTESGYFTGYNSSINPQLTNEFATAAMRFGHSVVTNEYPRYDGANNLIDEDLTFADINFKSEEAYNEERGGLDSFIFGLINIPSAAYDLAIADDLQNNIMDEPNSNPFDLAAYNINRGRDHGLPGYTKYLEYCTGIKITSFADLITEGLIRDTRVRRFERHYANVEDIDLWVGGLAEEKIGRADVITGPTFTCIIGEQFRDLKQGDRFYYENAPSEEHGTENSAFTEEQLTEIKKMSFSHLLCNNLNLDSVQPDVFFFEHQIRDNNVKRNCSTYENMDLSVW